MVRIFARMTSVLLAAATSRSRYLPPPRTGLGTQPSKTRIGYADGIVTNNERTTILSE
jgi:hypothetical protein